ncbi:transposase family protein [Streptomyces sp. NBC_01362]|uniref:transposase family protein n=1 Tax=Streptomyces sp. NBC_01362 TaxID=2903839 RepID=UPI002E332341|nr:transposase family protein [Streptomyces sp. NBC_01362]
MPSSLINVLARHCEDGNEPCPSIEPHEPASLSEVLAAVPDPRRVRGRRYRIGVLLGLCLTAVLGGARSLVQIALYAADTGPQVRAGLGLARATPNASTLGRLVARIDGDALDDTVGTWLARHAADPIEEDEALVGLAVDSKTAMHLLAAALHGCQTVIAQHQVAAKSNEVPAMARCWPASTCAVWSSPPTPCTPSERPGRRSSPPAGTTSWSSRATRRSCAGNCRARPGGRCRCWTAPAPPGTDVARSGG